MGQFPAAGGGCHGEFFFGWSAPNSFNADASTSKPMPFLAVFGVQLQTNGPLAMAITSPAPLNPPIPCLLLLIHNLYVSDHPDFWPLVFGNPSGNKTGSLNSTHPDPEPNGTAPLFLHVVDTGCRRHSNTSQKSSWVGGVIFLPPPITPSTSTSSPS